MSTKDSGAPCRRRVCVSGRRRAPNQRHTRKYAWAKPATSDTNFVLWIARWQDAQSTAKVLGANLPCFVRPKLVNRRKVVKFEARSPDFPFVFVDRPIARLASIPLAVDEPPVVAPPLQPFRQAPLSSLDRYVFRRLAHVRRADVRDQPFAECLSPLIVSCLLVAQSVPDVLMSDSTEAARRIVPRPRNPKAPLRLGHQRRIVGRKAHPPTRFGPTDPLTVNRSIVVPPHHQKVGGSPDAPHRRRPGRR